MRHWCNEAEGNDSSSQSNFPPVSQYLSSQSHKKHTRKNRPFQFVTSSDNTNRRVKESRSQARLGPLSRAAVRMIPFREITGLFRESRWTLCHFPNHKRPLPFHSVLLHLCLETWEAQWDGSVVEDTWQGAREGDSWWKELLENVKCYVTAVPWMIGGASAHVNTTSDIPVCRMCTSPNPTVWSGVLAALTRFNESLYFFFFIDILFLWTNLKHRWQKYGMGFLMCVSSNVCVYA